MNVNWHPLARVELGDVGAQARVLALERVSGGHRAADADAPAGLVHRGDERVPHRYPRVKPPYATQPGRPDRMDEERLPDRFRREDPG